MRRWFARLRRRGLPTQLATLVVAVLVVYALAAPVAGLLSGWIGLGAAGLGAGICLLGAGLALVACRLFCSPSRAVHGVLVGMLLRMGIPLGSALALQFQGGPLADAGGLVWLAVFYPVTLFVETALSLPSDEGSRPRGNVSADVVL